MNINKQIYHIRFFVSLLAFIVLQSCAHVSVPPPHPPFSDQEIAANLSCLKNQEDAVHNFFSSGRIMVQGGDSDFDANVLLAGTKDPFKIKLEITHSWGRPLFYILITATRLHIVSFTEKRYYLADMRDPFPLNLPPIRLDLDQLWAIGRGFPILYGHNSAVSTRENQISLLNEGGKIIQLIEFRDQNIFPVQVLFPVEGIKLSFSDFTYDNDIQYAKKTTLYDQKYKTMLILDIKQAAFNKDFDKSIFEITVPPDFECVQTNRLLDTN